MILTEEGDYRPPEKDKLGKFPYPSHLPYPPIPTKEKGTGCGLNNPKLQKRLPQEEMNFFSFRGLLSKQKTGGYKWLQKIGDAAFHLPVEPADL